MKKRVFLFLAAATVLLVTACNKTGLERTTLNTAEDYHARGLEYLNNGDYDSAIAEFTQAIDLAPDYAEAYSKRSYAYFNLFDAYIKEDLDITRDYWKLASADWADRDILVYTRRINFNPSDAFAYCWRGVAYAVKGNYDSAIADLTQALGLDPDNAKSYYQHRGEVYADKGDYDEAIADYEAALRIEPNNTLIQLMLENAWRMKNEKDSHGFILPRPPDFKYMDELYKMMRDYDLKE